MWLVIRWILLPWAAGRRIHPSISKFKRIRSKKFSEAGAGAVGCPPGGQGPAPASENASTLRWIHQLKDGFDGQLPMGEESIE